MAMKNKDYASMTPEELQALRDQADLVGIRDVEVGKLFQLLIPHVAHLHGLDPAEEDLKLLEAAQAKEAELRDASADEIDEESLTPAQKESKRQAEAQGKKYVPAAPGEDPTLDPLAKETQKRGAMTVPTAQAEEQLPKVNVLDPSISTHPNFSSSSSRGKHEDDDEEKGKK